MMLTEFDEIKALDNGAILRGLSNPLAEYDPVTWRSFCASKAQELGLPDPMEYLSVTGWLRAVAKEVWSTEPSHAIWQHFGRDYMLWHWAYHWMLTRSELRLLEIK